MTTTSDTRPEPLLQLVIPQSADGQASATVPVRWRLTHELVRQLETWGYTNPYILIVIRSVRSGSKMDHDTREYVDTDLVAKPLNDELTYVNFVRPGQNEIHAIIVDIDSAAAAAYLADVQGKIGAVRHGSESNFDTTGESETIVDTSYSVLNADGTIKSWLFGTIRSPIDTRAGRTVQVPSEMFAPEPPAWQKRLVRAYFRTREHDQCHFKWRLGLCSLASVGWIPLMYAAKLLLTVASVILGFRNIPFKRVFDPLELQPISVYKAAGESRWVYKTTKDAKGEQEMQNIFVALFSPPVLIIVPLLTYTLWNVFGEVSLIRATIYGVGVVVAIVVLLCLCVGAAAIYDRFAGSDGARAKRKQARVRAEADAKARAKAKAEADARAQLMRNLAAMASISPLDASAASVDELPEHKRTVWLRALKYKASHCLPFAKP